MLSVNQPNVMGTEVFQYLVQVLLPGEHWAKPFHDWLFCSPSGLPPFLETWISRRIQSDQGKVGEKTEVGEEFGEQSWGLFFRENCTFPVVIINTITLPTLGKIAVYKLNV